MKYFTKEHEWFDSKNHKVGLSSFAQKELGEVVFLQMPELGKEVSKGDELCILESTKAASDIYAPYSGRVTAVNHEAINFINDDPENKGWLVEITPAQALDVSSYLDETSYLNMLDK